MITPEQYREALNSIRRETIRAQDHLEEIRKILNESDEHLATIYEIVKTMRGALNAK